MIKYNGENIASNRGLNCNAPVLEINFESETTYPNGDKLPGVWITRPVKDDGGNELGRTYIALYPSENLDENDALFYGGHYYEEGMDYADPNDYEKRIECFQAAELLYRHAAGRGNALANLCLGYIYSYDRCQGRYWVDPMELNTAEDYDRSYPHEERAFECFHKAADVGIPEGCYKLGDMYKRGMGCDPDAAEAFSWYMRASELAQHEHPVILGSISLRLAGCYEEGLGCAQDFTRALVWYRRAVDGLQVAVDAGEWWFEKALANARAGAKRCAQEA